MTTEHSGLVYFIASSDGHVKIGHTRGSIKRRLAALQTASPVRLTLLAASPGSFRLERQLHALFQGQRVLGEWFKRSDHLDAIIELATRSDGRLLEPQRPGPKPTVNGDTSIFTWTGAILKIMRENPNQEFDAKMLGEILGRGRRAEIPSTLQGLCKRGRITRVLPGRYVYGR